MTPGPDEQYRGTFLDTGHQAWGRAINFAFFVVGPVLIGNLLTEATRRRVEAMRWRDLGMFARSVGLPPTPDFPGFPETRSQAEEMLSNDPATAHLAAEFANIRKEEAAVLAGLISCGPPQSWDVDPQLQKKVLKRVRRITPHVYEQWLAYLHFKGWQPPEI